MRNWARQVVDHKLQDGLDLLLGITSVVSKSSILEYVSVLVNPNDIVRDLPIHRALALTEPSTWRRQQPG